VSCYFCDEIQRIKDNQNDKLVAELPETYVLLKSSKLFPGYCLVVAKEHCEHLPELSKEKQLAMFADVITVANTIASELKPQRMNYECLGNLVPHIHWHVVPRYNDDPEPKGPIWKIDKSIRDQPNNTGELKQLMSRLTTKIQSVQYDCQTDQECGSGVQQEYHPPV
jgi:diadenosine tetraphosphate (Ap4A) HIT family hydrolase